ncbi:MAG TPA: hypothetical protein VFP98_06565, partial [Candidatus Polarisedimenticolia bacterium]|nr:hypothetical protein [Candidatus Polarisedimenticolia bacterium]
MSALLLLPGMAAGQDPGARLPAIEPPAKLPPVDPPITKAIEPGEPLDDLRILSIDPASGEIASASSGETLTRENSIEAVLEYDLVSSANAVVSAELRAPGAGRISSFEASPNRVYDENGRVRKRLAVSCGPDVSDRIRDLRIHYWMFVPGGRTLVDEEQPITHTIRCRADDLRIVSIDPASGEIASASSGETLTRENSIEVVLEYDLVSAPDAVVSAELQAPGSGRVTSIEASPNRVYDQHGRVIKRLGITCGPDASIRIVDLRIHYWMYVPGASTLADKDQSVPHTILCQGITGPQAAARLPDRTPPPRFETPPAAARAGERKQPPPEARPPAARANDVARPPAPAIDPGIAKRPPPVRIDPGVA